MFIRKLLSVSEFTGPKEGGHCGGGRRRERGCMQKRRRRRRGEGEAEERELRILWGKVNLTTGLESSGLGAGDAR